MGSAHANQLEVCVTPRDRDLRHRDTGMTRNQPRSCRSFRAFGIWMRWWCWKWRFQRSLFITCPSSRPRLTFPIHYQMSLALKSAQNFLLSGIWYILPARNASSSNPTPDKPRHILWLWLHPPQHPNPCGITSSSHLVHPALCALRAPHSPIFSPQIWDICKRCGSACPCRARAAVDPGFSSIPGAFCCRCRTCCCPCRSFGAPELREIKAPRCLRPSEWELCLRRKGLESDLGQGDCYLQPPELFGS